MISHTLPTLLLLALSLVSPSPTKAITTQSIKSYEAIPNTPVTIRCSPLLTHLAENTHKLISQCNEREFCLPGPTNTSASATPQPSLAQPWRNAKKVTMNGVCSPRLCRRDEFPFGYPDLTPDVKGKRRKNPAPVPTIGIINHALDRPPPMCQPGQFCPDDGSGCRGKLQAGEKCELNRDEQCMGTVGNPMVCMFQRCITRSVSINQPCLFENTTYLAENTFRSEESGEPFMTTIIKDNCSPGLFCEPSPIEESVRKPLTPTGTCRETKNVGQKCHLDNECILGNCAMPMNGGAGVCAVQPETPLYIAPAQIFAAALCLSLVLITSSIFLTFLHRRQQRVVYIELQTYHDEQMSLRRAIVALHTAAVTAKSQQNSRGDDERGD